MKQGNRKIKALSQMGARVLRKGRITTDPTNRAERRRLKKIIKKHGIKDEAE